MRHKLQALIMGLGSLFLLSACQEKEYAYLDLLLHPDELQGYYNQCVEKIAPAELPCDLITKAQADFTELTDRLETNPEDFGRQILQAEEALGALRVSVDEAMQAYEVVGKQNPGIDALRTARAEVDKAEEAYKVGDAKVKVLLAVIGANRPEV